ncbi:MAG: hypothetical protein JXB00_01085, partial [Bacteroidales bacterium]|nr:hypothetical protein [Bacteroidales bacterium]
FSPPGSWFLRFGPHVLLRNLKYVSSNGSTVFIDPGELQKLYVSTLYFNATLGNIYTIKQNKNDFSV